MKRAAFATLALLVAATSLLAQPKVSGFVFSLETGRPVVGATISLKDDSGLDLPDRSTLHSDQSGYYEFNDLKPGRYQLRIGSVYQVDEDPVRSVLVSSTFPVNDSAHVYVGLSELGLRSELARMERMRTGEEIRPVDRFGPMFFRSSIKDDSGKELLTASWAEDPESGETLY